MLYSEDVQEWLSLGSWHSRSSHKPTQIVCDLSKMCALLKAACSDLPRPGRGEEFDWLSSWNLNLWESPSFPGFNPRASSWWLQCIADRIVEWWFMLKGTWRSPHCNPLPWAGARNIFHLTRLIWAPSSLVSNIPILQSLPALLLCSIC